MAPNSSDVNAGDDALATDYNSLRADVLDPATGHKHTGKPGEGAAVPGSLLTDQDGMKGDGSDGSLTLSTLLELSGVKQFTDLTIDSGGEIRPASGKHFVVILVQGALIINSGGKIQADGFGGAGGGFDSNGTDGFVAQLNSLPEEVIGGLAVNAPNLDGLRSIAQVAALADSGEGIFVSHGAGGAGGRANAGSGFNGGNEWAGGGASTSGLGGAGGDIGGDGGGGVIIFAESITINAGGEITAKGADASQLANANSAGGGGGGLVYLASRSLTETGTVSAAGGLGGTSVTSGLVSGTGGAGIIARKTIPG